MFHKLPLRCPNCGKPATILELAFDDKGNIQISALCAPCGSELELETTAAAQIVNAHEWEILSDMFLSNES